MRIHLPTARLLATALLAGCAGCVGADFEQATIEVEGDSMAEPTDRVVPEPQDHVEAGRRADAYDAFVDRYLIALGQSVDASSVDATRPEERADVGSAPSPDAGVAAAPEAAAPEAAAPEAAAPEAGRGVEVDAATAVESEWASGVAYVVGQVVSYHGDRYVCVFSHTSQPDWAPPLAAGLWRKI